MVTVRMAAEPPPATPRLLDRVAGLAAFAVAVILLRLAPLRFVFTLVWTVKQLVRRPATREQAERAVAAGRWAARWFPGRAACLELSLTAVVATGFCGRVVDWCIGCRFGPCQSHAWIETNGSPIYEPLLHTEPFHITVRI